MEHASAVMKLEEERAKFEAMKKAFEDKMAEEKEKLREEREKVKEEKPKSPLTKLLSPLRSRSPQKAKSMEDGSEQLPEKEKLLHEREVLDKYFEKIQTEMALLRAEQSDIQKSHQEALLRIRNNPNLISPTQEPNDENENQALEQSLWEDMGGLTLMGEVAAPNRLPPKGNLNQPNNEAEPTASIPSNLLSVIENQQKRQPTQSSNIATGNMSTQYRFPPPRIGPTQLRNGTPDDLFVHPELPNTEQNGNYVFVTGDDDDKSTKIEIPKIPENLNELETYIDVLESLTDMYPRPKTFIYSILIKSNQMGLLPLLQPEEKESLKEFCKFLRTNFTGKDYFSRRKEFDTIKQTANENINLFWRRTWRAFYVSKEQPCPVSYQHETNAIIKKDIFFKFVNGIYSEELKKSLLLGDYDYDNMPDQAIKMESILHRSTMTNVINAVNEECYKCGSPSHKADSCQASSKIKRKFNRRISKERGRSPTRRNYYRRDYSDDYNKSRSSSRYYSGSRSPSRRRYSSNDSYSRRNRRSYENRNRSYDRSFYNRGGRSNSRERRSYDRNYRSSSRTRRYPSREKRRSSRGYRGRSERYRSRSTSYPKRSISREYKRENKGWNSPRRSSYNRENREKYREDNYNRKRSKSDDGRYRYRSPYPRVKFDDE